MQSVEKNGQGPRVEVLDLQALEYFVEVSEAGSFSKAAAIVQISQPTLSRHIQQLEESLGARLFGRTGRGVVLTEAGDTLLQHSRVLLGHAQQARADVSDIGNNPSGSVVLGLAPIAGRILSVPVSRRFLKEVRNGKLRIIECFTGYVHEWITSGRIDVGILYEDAVDSSLEGEMLWEERHVLVSRRSPELEGRTSIRLAELQDLPLVLPSRPHGLRMKIDRTAANAGVSLHVAFEIDGLNAILDLVLRGVGCTILTPPALHNFGGIADLAVLPIVEPTISSTAVVVCSKDRPRTNATRRLLRIIREQARRIRALDVTRAPTRTHSP